MDDKNLLETKEDGRKMYVHKVNENSPKDTIVKSDGTTLYLTRDIAAARHRKRL